MKHFGNVRGLEGQKRTRVFHSETVRERHRSQVEGSQFQLERGWWLRAVTAMAS